MSEIAKTRAAPSGEYKRKADKIIQKHREADNGYGFHSP
jgi:hypothetical protein